MPGVAVGNDNVHAGNWGHKHTRGMVALSAFPKTALCPCVPAGRQRVSFGISQIQKVGAVPSPVVG